MEAPAIGRVIALDAGLPVTVPGMQLDRRCGSGLQAVIQACMQVASGANDLVVAGGAESMSNVVFHSTDMRWGGARGGVKVHDALARGRTTAGGRHYPVPGGMLETAENLRRQYAITREEQDELAVASHQRAVAAQRDGLLAGTIIPVTVASRTARRDRHRRASACRHLRGVAGQAQTRSGQDDPDATVTAGNSSGQNDAASMCIVTTPEKAAELGLTPLVRLVSWGVGRGGAERDGHRAGAGHRGGAAQGRADAGRHRSHRTQRGLRRAGAGLHAGVEVHRRPTWSAPTCTARASRSVIRSARPAGGCWRRWRANSTAEAGATAWRRCASAAVRDWPPCSKGRAASDHGSRRPSASPRFRPKSSRRAAIRRQGDHSDGSGARARRHVSAGDRRAMKEMGLFGLMIPEEYGGLGESLLTYALCVEELARGWMSVSGVINTHFIVAYMIREHGTEEQKRKYLPRDGDRRDPWRLLDVGARARLRRRRDPHQGQPSGRRDVQDRRSEDVVDQRRAVRSWWPHWCAPTRAQTNRTAI